MMQCPAAAPSTSSATCHCCPDEVWTIFQPAHSATSAALIEILCGWTLTSDVSARLQYKCVSPLKAAYRSFFCPSVLKQSYLIKGALLTPPKLAVIFHLYTHEGRWSDTVIHLGQKLLLGQRKTTPPPPLHLSLLAVDRKSLKTRSAFWELQTIFWKKTQYWKIISTQHCSILK